MTSLVLQFRNLNHHGFNTNRPVEMSAFLPKLLGLAKIWKITNLKFRNKKTTVCMSLQPRTRLFCFCYGESTKIPYHKQPANSCCFFLMNVSLFRRFILLSCGLSKTRLLDMLSLKIWNLMLLKINVCLIISSFSWWSSFSTLYSKMNHL